MTGVLLAESVYELLAKKQPFTRENLEKTYVTRREKAGFRTRLVSPKTLVTGSKGLRARMVGMALTGLTKGRVSLAGEPVPPWQRIPTLEQYYRGRISSEEIQQMRKECQIKGTSLHSALMQRCGWPSVPYDGLLLVSHQDALLLGGKVQAPPGMRIMLCSFTRSCARNAARDLC
jgi:electron-transferring-flavoprotein dehydrogenase